MDGLSDEERARLGLQADRLLELVAARHGVTVNQAVEAIKWVHQHKEFVARLKNGGMLFLISTLITAAALALWEGIKHMVSSR